MARVAAADSLPMANLALRYPGSPAAPPPRISNARRRASLLLLRPFFERGRALCFLISPPGRPGLSLSPSLALVSLRVFLPHDL